MKKQPGSVMTGRPAARKKAGMRKAVTRKAATQPKPPVRKNTKGRTGDGPGGYAKGSIGAKRTRMARKAAAKPGKKVRAAPKGLMGGMMKGAPKKKAVTRKSGTAPGRPKFAKKR